MNNRIFCIVVITFIVLAAFFFLGCGKEKKVDAPKTSADEQKEAGIQGSEASGFVDADVSDPNAADSPVLTGVRLELKSSFDTDTLVAKPKAKVKGGGEITFKYQWTKNGEPAGETDSVTGFKRGDNLKVTITPYVGDKAGKSRVAEFNVANTPPKLMSIKEIAADKTSLTYKVEARDADGDSLVYSIEDAPEGVTIDQQGVIKWTFNQDNLKISFKVKIKDGHGGELTYPLSLGSGKMEPVQK